ncbi:DUF1203 domain-containing protein [Inhella sp.]|uniref:DUF1203 domain-containing protein n=1 Tax=Inhella sp. TaxID=1921806 RepID=UPI0035B48151
MSYRVLGLDPQAFLPLYSLSDAELQARGARRLRVTESHAAPDRIELRDAEPGETVLLLNHCYLEADTPYRGTHAIFVREGATQRFEAVGALPDAIRRRLISLRAFDADGMMVDAEVAEGAALEPLIARFLADPQVAFLHAHHARRGCYAARIERA